MKKSKEDSMRRLLFALCMLNLLWFTLVAQEPMTIGDGNIGFVTPVFPHYWVSYSQNIYLQSDFEQDLSSHWITKIAFWWMGGDYSGNTHHIRVLIGETTATSFADDNSLIPETDLTEVYNGIWQPVGAIAGWKEINLFEPYIYSNVDNLVVCFTAWMLFWPPIDNVDAIANTLRFAGTETAGVNRSLVYASDNFNYDIITDPSSERFLIQGFANLQLYHLPIPTSPVFSIIPNTYTFDPTPFYRTVNQRFEIVNSGLQGTITSLQINQTGIPYFTFTTPHQHIPFSMPFGDALSVNVTFNPGIEPYAIRTADLVITTDSPENPVITIPISGSNGGFVSIDAISENTNTISNLNPHNPQYDFSFSQFIYTQSQINRAMQIGKIALHWNGGSNGSQSNYFEIYLGQTNLSSFGEYYSASSWIPPSNFTLVFAGIIDISAEDCWIEIPLNRPFSYNNYENLAIAFNEVASSHLVNDQGFFIGSLAPNRGIRVQRNGDLFQLDTVTQSPASQNIGGYPHIRFYVNNNPNINEDIQPVRNLSLQVTFQTVDGDVVLNWDEPNSSTMNSFQGYWVYRNQMLQTPSPILENTLSQPNILTGRYNYQVVAVYTNDFSERESVLAVVAPPFVTNLNVEVYDSSVAISWTAPPLETVTGYKVYRDETLLTTLPFHTTIFVDTTMPTGTYTYGVVAVYPFGESELVLVSNVQVSDGDIILMPPATKLTGNYPNPFNPSTTIAFDIADSGVVNIEIFNVRGQRVLNLVNDNYTAGKHSVVWNGTDALGSSVSSGVYFYRMTTGGYTAIRKMLLMK